MPHHIHTYKSPHHERLIAFSDSSSVDAFHRLRVSNIYTEFAGKQIHDNLPLLWDDQEVSGGSTSSTYTAAKASTTIGVAASTAGNRTRQTFRRFNYEPGKSQLILMTGTMPGATSDGITARVGYFDDNDGIFFEEKDQVLAFVVRTSTSGSPSDAERVEQTSWNIDKMNGSGPSGILLDDTKDFILVIDFQWLGTGRVRVGFEVGGDIIYCHEFLHANENTNVYMSTPNLPLRYEIENDGTGPAATMQTICATVISEGGDPFTGVNYYISTGNTGIDATTGGTNYTILAVRLKSTHLDATVVPIDLSVLVTTADDVEWSIIMNPTINSVGTLSWTSLTNGPIEYAVGSTTHTITNGAAIDGGFISQATKGASASHRHDKGLVLGSAIDGTRDIMVLAARPLGSGAVNAVVHGGLMLEEMS